MLYRFFYLLFLAICSPLFAEPKVLVSIAPYQTIAQEIGGDTIQVDVVVPPGASAHTYEPKPRQIVEYSKADAWFTIGEPFEQRAIEAMKSHRASLQIIDLRESVQLIYGSACPHCVQLGKEAADLHFWLSPLSVQQQVPQIVETLSSLYPEHAKLYQKNGKQMQEKLSALHRELQTIFSNGNTRFIFVSHPAYGYLARDYQFEQIPVEVEGKDPSPRQLAKLLAKAREKQAKVIFVQEQHSMRGATRIAQELDARVVVLNPYDSDYFSNLRHIAQQFANQ